MMIRKTTKFGRLSACLFTVLLSATAASLLAQEGPPPLPEGGENLLGQGTPESYVLRNKKDAVAEKAIVLAEPGQPFDKMTRVTVTQASGKPWDSALDINLASNLTSGDLAFLRFYYRTAPGGTDSLSAEMTVQIGEWKPPFSKVLDKKLDVTNEWQRCDLVIPVTTDLAAKVSELTFLLGTAAQTVDIAGVQLVNFHQTVAPATLPPDGEYVVSIESN